MTGMTRFQWIIVGIAFMVMILLVTLVTDNAKQNSEDKARDQLCMVVPSSPRCWEG